MQIQKFAVPLASALLLIAAHRYDGWGGVAIALGALVMWLLLHFTRMMQILKRAANRPIGFVDSAMHVVAMTRALGELRSPRDSQPELFRWTDGTQSHVTCEFHDGKLKKWDLVRPPAAQDAAIESGPAQDS